jgi:hypothetical protein
VVLLQDWHLDLLLERELHYWLAQRRYRSLKVTIPGLR